MIPMSLRIDYIEFPATDIAATKRFYQEVFSWVFTDYGPDYTSFADGRIAGGFTKETQARPLGPLIVIYAEDLAGVQAKIQAANGKIVKPIFEFPGGKRFHFTDPSGNELSVWSDK
jgi:predicted enzyme related to lactoylglutathione lyase